MLREIDNFFQVLAHACRVCPICNNVGMLREIDNFFLQKDEPVKGCLLFLRDHILDHNKNITEAWKYKMPFYCYNGKMFCYLWVHKKNGMPYLGVVDGNKIDHPGLISENRSRMKILLLDPATDIPIETIDTILKAALDLLPRL